MTRSNAAGGRSERICSREAAEQLKKAGAVLLRQAFSRRERRRLQQSTR
jgi:hypothetical protein